mmetsp:Transcript_15449/g.13192  ORF Transcript_15449/g.13192 Transcript_15449/m.13192 type:complete len:158 (+) Transcript_15449:33-506(+)
MNLREKMEMHDMDLFTNKKECVSTQQSMGELERNYRDKVKENEFTINQLKQRLTNFENADFALLETNKNLSIALERADTRCFNYEKKIEKLKKFQKVYKNATDISCRYCQKLVKKNLFVAHLEICSLNEEEDPRFHAEDVDNQLQESHLQINFEPKP